MVLTKFVVSCPSTLLQYILFHVRRQDVVTGLLPVIKVLRQLLQQLFEHVIVQILGDVKEEQPVAEIILVRDPEHIPWIELSGTGHGKYKPVE